MLKALLITAALWSSPLAEPAHADAVGCEPAANASPDKVARDEITQRLEHIATTDADFFDQLQLWFARTSFARALAGATSMVALDGTIDPSCVDAFHEYLDEFLRALRQLQSNEWPGIKDFGSEATDAATRLERVMTRDELRAVAKRLIPEISALKKLANGAPGLRDLECGDSGRLDLPTLFARTQRVIFRVRVITNHCGIGPVFKGASAEAEPLREALIGLAQSANALLSSDEKGTSARSRAFQEKLGRALEHAKNLGRTAPAWKSASNGSRGALVVSALEMLERDFARTKATLPRR